MFDGIDPYAAPSGSKSIVEILEDARSYLQRLSPRAAHKLLTSPDQLSPPSVLVDIRPLQQRQIEGEIPGAFVIERNVLEWRFDPKSDARLPVAERWDLRVVVFCSEGYTSSLAARSLQELGLWNATDIVGGYKAWKMEGLGGVPLGG
ncbi:rhodanese-like protein [Bisporella sp. PMI_857]|nr:rhodanese-like protein [Bisporella sp. PMI_857]